jgi:phosphatidylglycerophosphate synthase
MRIDILALGGIVIIGSLLVSYVRARAEAIGERCDVGIAERAERLLILAGGLIFGIPGGALWILAILTHLTVLHRVLHVRAQLREDSGSIHSAGHDKFATPEAKIEP